MQSNWSYSGPIRKPAGEPAGCELYVPTAVTDVRPLRAGEDGDYCLMQSSITNTDGHGIRAGNRSDTKQRQAQQLADVENAS